MNGGVTIIDLMDHVFPRWFAGDSWRAWRVALKAMFALPLDADEFAIFQAATGRATPSDKPAPVAWFCVGRRGGKSLIAALVAVYCACFRVDSAFVAPGEVVTIMLVAADRRQARTMLRYVRGFLNSAPQLQRLIVCETRETIELSNGV